jgi:membrane fusion protein (multidrug efflux system)
MEETKQAPDNKKRKIMALTVFGLVTIIGIIAVYSYVRYKSVHITTDDAFVEGRIHTIASKVEGTVKTVHAKDNQFVKKGDLLVEMDDADYDVRVREADAVLNADRSRRNEILSGLEVAKKQMAELNIRVETAKANLELQNANLRQAEIDLKRAENLSKNDAISKDKYDKAKTGYDVAAAQFKAAKEQLRQAESSIETQHALIKQAATALKSQESSIKHKEAVLKRAELNRSYTKIYAPADGYVSKRSVEAGNQIRDGQPLMAVVPLDDIWVTANYKETQIEKIKTGQKVEIKVDSYPKKTFTGRVESIMAGTGAVFSLFPPENATGHYVKITQRIPVKIVLDSATDKEHVLRVGMSVAPTVIVQK